MPEKLYFTKMQGIGNDYIYINGFNERVDNPADLARRMSDRHFGVGADGLILILPSAVADVRMRIFNADGSEAEMCGNAARCVGKYAYEHEIVSKDVVRLETASGVKIVHLRFEAGVVCGATVDMGEPILEPSKIPVILAPALTGGGNKARFISRPVEIGNRVYAVTAVSMGNPHAVVFMKDIDALDVAKIGPLFECNPLFPRRTNTEFVEVLASDRIRMRVWERGAGETLACGTGACAATVASVLNGFAGRSLDVVLKGGTLHIKWDESDGHIYMTGGAVTVFEGTYPVD